MLGIFVDVELDELKQDVIEFYDMFVEVGFLSRGETYEECTDQRIIQDNDISDTDTSFGEASRRPSSTTGLSIHR